MNTLTLVTLTASGLMLLVGWIFTTICWWGILVSDKHPLVRLFFAVPVMAITLGGIIYSVEFAQHVTWVLEMFR